MTQLTARTRLLRRFLAAPVALAAGLVGLAPAAPSGAADIGTPPVRKIAVPSGNVSGAAIANDGRVFALDGSDLVVYAPGAKGVATPQKVITGLGSSFLAIPSYHPARGIVLASGAPSGVVVVDPGQPDGPVAPTRTITGPATQIEDPFTATWAPDGSIWVLDTQVDGAPGLELLRFPAGADGDVAPNRSISGPRTGLDEVAGSIGGGGLDVLSNGSVVVGSFGWEPLVHVFAPSKNGNAAPSRTLYPRMEGPSWVQYGMAVDSADRIYVTTGDFSGNQWGSVAVYAAGAKGSARPVLELTGSGPAFGVPALPALAADDTLVVTDVKILFGETGPGSIKVFKALPKAPGAPRSLKTAKRGKSVTLAWKAPAKSGGAAVRRYVVQVKKGGRTVLSSSVTGTRLTVRRSKLPAGKLTAVVTAVNVAGAGPAATKSFRK
ncbi:fibronectin type III domain-containing protein [Nocardioides sp. TF02-7]|uniref:fibronectin type III domain-containing protein n=1 Tax=Nocardioides sp. TF02-7 TaxID=2917724 RepID=UPI001F06CCAD|nr:fibronectin type III domain-containing protein [Nocardioides sp. TF02-7]UMG93327.1 fibronectin type III domain-containing protein [Nocardioides sp. TF02-7]